MNTNKETAADSAVAMQNRQGLGEIRLDGRILTRTVLQAKHDNRAASQSSCHETQTERIRHPLLLGLICGYLLRTLTRLILGF